ncbi:hypothetical protein [Alicyclobacillus sp. SO9]|uniref:hypothetical protein n=1 Tax=Alicyclobacillus sp. SO9 TaxID=2665646 RepID=UPI0018E8E753|nr:hypothetical protein [Alicyclobacillus sp. SO9]QQE79754.1 hypothetical protein GI364_04495 [Alicyclobacillus sp. SO9]
MLIVITRDEDVMEWASSPESGADAWGSIRQLSAGTQSDANREMRLLLSQVQSGEPLCITGHGNDTEVGDEGSHPADWTWTHSQLAALLAELGEDYIAPILMEVCAETVTDFAAHLVLSLEKRNALAGVWVYGYNKSISIRHPFPKPVSLDKNLELYAKQVQ